MDTFRLSFFIRCRRRLHNVFTGPAIADSGPFAASEGCSISTNGKLLSLSSSRAEEEEFVRDGQTQEGTCRVLLYLEPSCLL
jgi:hypothetical protein